MFYDGTLRRLIDAGTISTGDTVLVVCGGSYDADVLRELGFTSVILSNLDDCYAGHDADYIRERQDAENLSYGDISSTSRWFMPACITAPRRIARCSKCTASRARPCWCSKHATA